MTKHFEAVADALATGCLLSAYYNRLGASAIYVRLQSKTALYLMTCIGLIAFGNVIYLVRPGEFYVWGQTIANVGTGLCVDWAIRHPQHRIGHLLNARPMVAIGVLSYSISFCRTRFPKCNTECWTTFPQNIFFAVSAAVLTYFVIEKPFLRIKDVLERRVIRGRDRLAPVPSLA